MSQNTETIEARLAAYVDGDLDAQGRAEIEKHLAANPQHRKLMAELMSVRAMVQALPHERAPGDLAEALQGQLERSSLLGQDGGLDTVLRISRWPQILSVAAVLLLAVGLAAVVYVVVSPGSGPSYTISTPLPVPSEDVNDPVHVKERAATDRMEGDKALPEVTSPTADVLAKKSSDVDPSIRRATGAAESPSEAMVKREIESNASSESDAVLATGSVQLPDQKQLQDVLTQRKVPSESLVLLVQSPDVNVTGEEIVDYLVLNRVPFEADESATPGSAGPLPMKLSIEAKQSAVLESGATVQGDQLAAVEKMDERLPAPSTTTAPAELAQDAVHTAPPEAPSTRPAPTTQESMWATGDSLNTTTAGAPTNGPSPMRESVAGGEGALRDLGDGKDKAQAWDQSAPGADGARDRSANLSRDQDQVIVIRKVTRQQAAELRATLLDNQYRNQNVSRADQQLPGSTTQEALSAMGKAGTSSPTTIPIESSPAMPEATRAMTDAGDVEPQTTELQALSPTTQMFPTTQTDALVDVVIVLQRSGSRGVRSNDVAPASPATQPMPATLPTSVPATMPAR